MLLEGSFEYEIICAYLIKPKRFACKEACFKALPDLEKYSIKNIEVVPSCLGSISIEIKENSRLNLKASISHDRDYAISTVIYEKN